VPILLSRPSNFVRIVQEDLEVGPMLVLQCDPYGKTDTEIGVRANLLARFSEKISELAALETWGNPPHNEVIGRITLPNIDANAAQQAVQYLEGGDLMLSASDRMGKKTTLRNLSRLAQISSFAHIFGIVELQRAAMQGLFHFLICYKQEVRESDLRQELARLHSGCPALLILKAGLRRYETQGSVASTPGESAVTNPGKGLARVEKFLALAIESETAWIWANLEDRKWKTICKNRKASAVWSRGGPLADVKRSFGRERTRITSADAFWRPGGARGAILNSDLPPPRLLVEQVKGHESPRPTGPTPDLLSQKLPPSLALALGDQASLPGKGLFQTTDRPEQDPKGNAQIRLSLPRPVTVPENCQNSTGRYDDPLAIPPEGYLQTSDSATGRQGPAPAVDHEDLGFISQD
jgi:hypothetical protein